MPYSNYPSAILALIAARWEAIAREEPNNPYATFMRRAARDLMERRQRQEQQVQS